MSNLSPIDQLPYMINFDRRITFSMIKHILLLLHENKISPKYVLEKGLFKPKGGQVYIFRNSHECSISESVKDWFSDAMNLVIADGYNWQKIWKRVLPNARIRKDYFRNSPVRNGNTFTKTIYSEVCSNVDNKSKECVHFFVVHYCGQETFSTFFPHGNRKRHRGVIPNVRNSHLIKRIIRSKFKENNALMIPETPAILVRQDRIRQKKLWGKDFNLMAGFNGARNDKQIRNIIAYEKRNHPLIQHSDEIFNLHFLSKQNELFPIREFVRKIVLHPFKIIICAHPDLLNIARLECCRYFRDKSLRQQFSYDTTFNLGSNFYLSTLVMRRCDLVNDPIFPVAFMLHDKRVSAVHDIFMNFLDENLFSHSSLQMDRGGDLSMSASSEIPFTIDREQAIFRAIKPYVNDENLFFCANHISQNMKRYLASVYPTNCKFRKELYDQFKNILRANNREEFIERSKHFKNNAGEAVSSYYCKSVEHDVQKYALIEKAKRFSAFKKKNPKLQRPQFCLATTNNSESFHNMLKVARYNRPIYRPDYYAIYLYERCNEIIQKFQRFDATWSTEGDSSINGYY